MSENKKNLKKVALKIIVSSILLAFLFSKVDKNELIAHFSLLNWNLAPVIIGLICANYIVSSIRWKKLLIFENAETISVTYLTHLYFIGSFFNNFMPTSVGGDVYKIFKLSKKLNNTAGAFSATFMERFTGVLALVIISIVSLYERIGVWAILLLVFMVVGFFVGLYVLKIMSTKVKKLQKLYDSLNQYRNRSDVITYALVTSFIVQILALLTQYVIFLAIGAKPPLLYSFTVLPVITLASFFIPSLNGIGVQDALYIQFFGLVGISESVALSSSILYHLFRLAVSLFGGILYALGKDE